MMGDSSGGRTVRIESNTESDDWRAGMTTDMRMEAVNRLYGMLKTKVPVSNTDTLNDIARVALGCEEKLFQKAAKKENYIMGLKRKIDVIERSNYADVRASSSTSGLTQNSELHGAEISCSLHNAFQLSHDFFGKLDGQEDTQLNVSVTQMDTPRILPSQQVAYQQCQQQQLQHQFLKHNAQQQTSCPAHVHHNINKFHVHQQQQHIVPQPSQMQYSEQMILPTPLHGQASGQQSNAILFQQKQQFNQQNNLSLLQNSVFQTNGEYFSGVQNLRNMVGPQSKALNLQLLQHSSQILQHTEVTGLQPKFQQPMQGVKLEQVLGSQKQSFPSHVSMQQKLQTSAALHQPQNVFDQQKLFQSRVFPGVSSASLESMAASEPAKDADYIEQAYQKIQSLKKQYQHHLEYLHEKCKCASQKEMRVDVSDKYKKTMFKLEKIFKFFSMSRVDIIRHPRIVVDRFYHDIKLYLARSVSNSASNQHHVQVTQPTGGQTPTSHLQRDRDLKLQFNTANSALRSTVIGSSSLSATLLENQNLHSNIFNSIPYDSQVEIEQRNATSMLQHELHQNTSGASAESNISRNSRVNAFDSAAKNPAEQPQHLERLVRPQCFQQKKQQVLMQNNHLGIGTGMANPLASKPSNSSDQMLLLRTPTQLHASSLPMFQHSRTPSDLKNLSLLSKARLTLQSATPLAIPSHSSPLNSSSTSVAHAKDPSGVSPLSISEFNAHSQTSDSLAQDMIHNQVDNQSLSIGISDMSASPLPTDITGPDGQQQPRDTNQPIERLIKAVESMSTETLCSAVHDIESVVNVVDMIAETPCGSDTAGAVVDDSVYPTRCNTWVGNSSHRECSFSKKIKRKISVSAWDTMSSFLSEIDGINQQSDLVHDSDSTAVLKPKRQRIEPRHALLDEIRSINQRLIETVIDLDSTEAGEGTIVRCSYNPVALSGYVKPHISSQWSMLPLLLFIPASYPNSSPEIFDGLSTVGESGHGKEAVDDSECNDEDLSMKAKKRFSMSLRKLSAPMSLEDMAMTWDKCARAVLSEYVQHFGGSCFSSIYGSWEDCITAA
ncbi:mediator of RNA polymerase II transcription subunit 15a-like [Tripterygium wilfordii]|uniref:Mediator of RNA polymerase II transcription subunit 15a-like n=1 Tax=Tripterygium wilfordii TaxID=458696 RepID=A0A7J7DVJ3_TRIWF|nr:mediator of RNA polymerase II transcription subunit 15a-like [Tripterygium wilfordii]KAF5750321.1 mediator of RNA polymerase II transcription subunit 15a-like [Tripterygium wilfordii]